MSISHRRRGGERDSPVDAVAGNGLLDRRALLGGIVLAGAAGSGITVSQIASAEPLTDAPWSLEPGAAIAPYEVPSRFEKSVTRTLSNPSFQPGAQGARTPITSSTAQSLRTDCITSFHMVVRQISIPTSTDW